MKLTAQASVQFAGDREMYFRIISVDPRSTYTGWVWLTGYALDGEGRATDRREVFVQCAGLVWATPTPGA